MNGITRIYPLPLCVFLTSTGKMLMFLPYVILLVIATAWRTHTGIFSLLLNQLICRHV